MQDGVTLFAVYTAFKPRKQGSDQHYVHEVDIVDVILCSHLHLTGKFYQPVRENQLTTICSSPCSTFSPLYSFCLLVFFA